MEHTKKHGLLFEYMKKRHDPDIIKRRSARQLAVKHEVQGNAKQNEVKTVVVKITPKAISKTYVPTYGGMCHMSAMARTSPEYAEDSHITKKEDGDPRVASELWSNPRVCEYGDDDVDVDDVDDELCYGGAYSWMGEVDDMDG